MLTPLIRAKGAALRVALQIARLRPPRAVTGDHGAVLDPRVAVMWKIASRANTPVSRLTPATARRETRDAILAVDPGRPSAVGVEQLTVDGEPGTGQRKARLYTPSGLRPGSAILIWFHQGGYVVGGLDESDTWCASLAKHGRVRVLNVDYRHAPEHPFPAYAEDGLGAYRWVQQHAESMGADPKRIAVGGASAGGNLAAGLSVRLRDGSLAPPAWQLLLFPMVDSLETGGSVQSQATCYPLDRPLLDWYNELSTPNAEDRSDLRISPLRASSLGGLPPTLVVTAGFDPLRDQGDAFADKIRADGGDVEHRRFDTLPHSCHVMASVVPVAENANMWICGRVRTAVGG